MQDALTVREHLVAAGVAVEDEMNVARDVAFSDAVRSRWHIPHPWHKRPQRGAVGVAQFLEAFELADQRILHRVTAAKSSL
ncbi:hypothetical protein MKK63_28110, partial [Methylobacterium sp. J-088]|uniref:hypothetical protein n=1 Tax=Methylobacterium sp. J-088 TaxID=2836664 RepID=UPI001FB9108E